MGRWGDLPSRSTQRESLNQQQQQKKQKTKNTTIRQIADFLAAIMEDK